MELVDDVYLKSPLPEIGTMGSVRGNRQSLHV